MAGGLCPSHIGVLVVKVIFEPSFVEKSSCRRQPAVGVLSDRPWLATFDWHVQLLYDLWQIFMYGDCLCVSLSSI
jgi:hypothetical protein